MDRFDEYLKERAKAEPFPVPEGYAGRVLHTCAGLQETTLQAGKEPARRGCPRWMGWAAAAVVLLTAVPNVSPTAAAALADVPVLGTIVRLVTFRTYTYNDGHSDADVSVPQLEGSDAAKAVSDEVRAYTDQLIAQFQKDCQVVARDIRGWTSPVGC